MSKQLICVLLFTAFAMAQKPVPELPRAYIDTTWNPPTGGVVWHAHTSVDFQAALNSSFPGDTIILDAGSVYKGNFTIPAKANPSNKWIYIESSALANLPKPGMRVGPSNAPNMPKIASLNLADAIYFADGANYWRLTGLEVTSSSTTNDNPPCPGRGRDNRWYNCATNVLIDSPQVGPPIHTNNITIDRCYLHGSPTQDVLRGVDLEVISGAVIDSYFSDIHKSVQESQAILAYFTPGPLKIVDNYLSSAGEDMMFGGSGVPYDTYVPSDIEIRRNHFINPISWNSCGDGGTVQPCQTLAGGTVCQGTNPYTLQVCGNPDAPINQWDIKNNLEFKNAQRVIVTGNVMENSWVSGQTGSSVLFTPRSTQSGPQTVVDDITVQSNILKNVTKGFNTLEYDDGCQPPSCNTPGESKRVALVNNLVLLADSADTYQHWGIGIGQDLTDYVFQHNTVLMADGSACFGETQFNSPLGWGWPPPGSYTHNFWLVDNAMCRQPSGDNGGQGTYGLTYYMGDPSPLAPRFYGNVMFVPSGDKVADWTGLPHNYATMVPLTYVNPGNGDYQLASPLWTDTTDGRLSGISWAILQAASGMQSSSGGPGMGRPAMSSPNVVRH